MRKHHNDVLLRPGLGRLGLTAAVCILALAACDSGPSYGTGVNTNFTPKPIASPSPSPESSPTPVAVATHPVGPPPATHRPTPAPPPQSVAEVDIQSDNQPPQMNPQQVQIVHGSAVKWVNHDSVTRTISANDGSFTSPPIPPGGTWQRTFPAAGDYPYHDDRPYAGGDVLVK